MAWLRRERRGSSGAAAEALALKFLEGRNLTLVERNYRCRLGEIDLIMRDGDDLVFVEVRLRGNTAFVGAGESISHRKQARIVAAANHYLAGKREVPCRFDCVLLDKLDPSAVEWLKNAFGA